MRRELCVSCSANVERRHAEREGMCSMRFKVAAAAAMVGMLVVGASASLLLFRARPAGRLLTDAELAACLGGSCENRGCLYEDCDTQGGQTKCPVGFETCRESGGTTCWKVVAVQREVCGDRDGFQNCWQGGYGRHVCPPLRGHEAQGVLRRRVLREQLAMRPQPIGVCGRGLRSRALMVVLRMHAMRLSQRTWLLVVAGLALCANPCGLVAGDGAQMPVGDIVAGIRAAADAMPPVRVRLKVEEWLETQAGARPIGRTSEYVYERIADPAARMGGTHEYVDPWSKVRHKERFAWVSGELRHLDASRGQGGTVVHRGSIAADGSLALRGAPLSHFLWWYHRVSVADFIEQDGGGIVEWAGDGPDNRAVIRTRPCGKDQRWLYEFHVMPDKGFAIPYRAERVRRDAAGAEGWVLARETITEDFTELQQGVWLPRKAVDTAWQVFYEGADAAKPPTLLWRYEYEFSWEANPPLDDAFFEVEFPPGTRVNDSVAGRRYTLARVTDQMMADQVAAAKRLAQEAGEEASGAGRARMLFAACVAVLIAAGLIIYRFKRRRRAA